MAVVLAEHQSVEVVVGHRVGFDPDVVGGRTCWTTWRG